MKRLPERAAFFILKYIGLGDTIKKGGSKFRLSFLYFILLIDFFEIQVFLRYFCRRNLNMFA